MPPSLRVVPTAKREHGESPNEVGVVARGAVVVVAAVVAVVVVGELLGCTDVCVGVCVAVSSGVDVAAGFLVLFSFHPMSWPKTCQALIAATAATMTPMTRMVSNKGTGRSQALSQSGMPRFAGGGGD